MITNTYIDTLTNTHTNVNIEQMSFNMLYVVIFNCVVYLWYSRIYLMIQNNLVPLDTINQDGKVLALGA